MSYSAPGGFDPGSLMPNACVFDVLRGVSAGGSIGGAAWPSANLALYIPYRVNSLTWVRRFFYWTSNATGNIDIGIYTRAGVKIISTGATAQGSTNTHLTIDVTDTLLQPGDYWLAMSLASATAQPYRMNGAAYTRLTGVCQEASAHPLPSTMTPVVAGQDYIPFFGFSTLGADL